MKAGTRVWVILLIVALALPWDKVGGLFWTVASAQGPEDVGIQSVTWLEAHRNATGSWGQTVPIRDTSAVVQTLAELQPGSATLAPAYAWLANQPPHNNADRARIITTLARAGFDVSALVADLQATQNAPAADPGEPFTYQDDFSDPDSGWLESGGGTVREYTGGEYRVLVKTAGYASWSSGGPMFEDVDVQVQARYEGAAQSKAGGLLFRFQDNANFYGFFVDPVAGEYALYKVEGGSWSKIVDWTVSAAIHSGETANQLRADCEGSQITLYANSQQLAVVTDGSFGEGKLGLIVYNIADSAGADFYFDDLTATGTYDLVRPNDPEGGWGLAPGYASDSLHTALVLQALHAAGQAGASLSVPVDYLLATQNGDGGWGIAKEAESNLYITTQVMFALISYVSLFDVQEALDGGQVYLLARQNPDGGWGDDGSTIHEAAMTYLVLQALDVSPDAPDAARSYLLLNRWTDGSWNGRPYDTALALLALGEADPFFSAVYLPLVVKRQ